MRALPTGPNPLAPLDEFVIIRCDQAVALCLRCGRYHVTIDPQRETGHFTNGTYQGRFWLAGRALIGTEHLMPREVQLGLLARGIEVLA